SVPQCRSFLHACRNLNLFQRQPEKNVTHGKITIETSETKDIFTTETCLPAGRHREHRENHKKLRLSL
ncbi:MAG: hypothetical protein JW849_06870, partial [Phycisphaerae bacterium]|nr:hypothetical protein [Phycisphaerae bacterium]